MPTVILALVAVVIGGVAVWGMKRTDSGTLSLLQTDALVLTAGELRSVSRALQRDALNLIREDEKGQAGIKGHFAERLAEMTDEALD